jgi:hypothetical protein
VFRACLFCHASLGTTQELESLPGARRVAFDHARGRLWIICLVCHRWNLTPFEDRWDAIEECERRFRATRVRLSTDHVGVARLGDGTDLVRVGKPLRPEFAAWRYGREFLSRRPRNVLRATAGAGLFLSPVLLAFVVGPITPLLIPAAAALNFWRQARTPVLRVPLSGGEQLVLSQSQIGAAELLPEADTPEGWCIAIEHLEDRHGLRSLGLHERFLSERALLTGEEARAAATFILPRLNPAGGSRAQVTEAVRWLEAVPEPHQVLARFARSPQVRPTLERHKATLATMHPEVRLALEMAVHETEEQNLLRGELSMLERAWRREEQLAAIADRLTVPTDVAHQLAGLLQRRAGA